MLDKLAHNFLTLSIVQEIATEFPRFRPLLDIWQSDSSFTLGSFETFRTSDGIRRGLLTNWGEAKSVWNEFVYFTLNVFSKNPKYLKDARTCLAGQLHGLPCAFDIAKITETCVPPWSIFDLNEAREFAEGIYPPWLIEEKDLGNLIYAYSAASQAVRFLSYIPDTSRGHLRRITLQEEKAAILNPASHAQGLVSFCRDNPRLKIQCCVKLWTVGICHVKPYIKTVQGDLVIKLLGRWMLETLVLQKHGMPHDQYQLVLDGHPL